MYYAYHLQDTGSFELGSLGEIRLCRLTDKITKVSTITPPLPNGDELGKREAHRRVFGVRRDEKIKHELNQVIGSPPDWAKAIPYLFNNSEEIAKAQMVFRWERIQAQKHFVEEYFYYLREERILTYEQIENLGFMGRLEANRTPQEQAGDVTQGAAQTKPNGLPSITDPTDQLIYDIVSKDPDLTDDQVAKRLSVKSPKTGEPLSRQAINTRRNKIGAMGYTVR